MSTDEKVIAAINELPDGEDILHADNNRTATRSANITTDDLKALATRIVELEAESVAIDKLKSVVLMDGSHIFRGDGGWRVSSTRACLDDEYTYTTFGDALEMIENRIAEIYGESLQASKEEKDG